MKNVNYQLPAHKVAVAKKLAVYAGLISLVMMANTAFGAGLEDGLNTLKTQIETLRKWFYIILVPVGIVVLAFKVVGFLQNRVDWMELVIFISIFVILGAIPLVVPWALGVFGAI